MVTKSGAVILNNDKQSILLVYRKRLDNWSFPKGHMESGEDKAETMIREIKEETGLTVRIIHELPDHHYTHPTEGEVKTKMYLVQPEDNSKLKTEFEGDILEWVPINEVVKKLSFDNLKVYFELIKPELGAV